MFRIGRPRWRFGVRVSVFLPSQAPRRTVLRNVGISLLILEKYSPRDLARLQNHVKGILVLGDTGGDRRQLPLGEWLRDPGYILVPEHHVVPEDAHLAATLVHETT